VHFTFSLVHTNCGFPPRAIFHSPWTETRLSERIRKHKVGITSIVHLAIDAWDAMFPKNADGITMPHQGLMNAFRKVGIMPYNPKALSDDAFKPAEMAGKALQDAKVKAGIADLTPQQQMQIVDEALPFVPAVPVDIESAKRVARKSRQHVPELLTEVTVRERQARKILDKEAKEQEMVQKRRDAAARKAANQAARAAAATAKAERVASAVPLRPRGARSKTLPLAATSEPIPVEISPTAPLAGQKRSAASASIAKSNGGAESHIKLRNVRKAPIPTK
jgi:hypothetical protein